jgi:hypothetical protein
MGVMVRPFAPQMLVYVQFGTILRCQSVYVVAQHFGKHVKNGPPSNIVATAGSNSRIQTDGT